MKSLKHTDSRRKGTTQQRPATAATRNARLSRIGPEIARGLGGGSIHSYTGDASKVVKVMPYDEEALKEVLIQMYVNRLDKDLAPLVYDYGMVNRKTMFIVMERIDGTLDKRMKDGWKPGCADVAFIDSLISRLHAIGVAHYDLHGGNIGYKWDGKTFVPKIIDFGWAEIAPRPVTANVNRALATDGELRNARQRKKPFLNANARQRWRSFCG